MERVNRAACSIIPVIVSVFHSMLTVVRCADFVRVWAVYSIPFAEGLRRLWPCFDQRADEVEQAYVVFHRLSRYKSQANHETTTESTTAKPTFTSMERAFVLPLETNPPRSACGEAH